MRELQHCAGIAFGPLRRELSRHHREFAELRSAIHRARFARLTGETPLGMNVGGVALGQTVKAYGWY